MKKTHSSFIGFKPNKAFKPRDKQLGCQVMAIWGGLTNSCEKKRGEKQRRKGKI